MANSDDFSSVPLCVVSELNTPAVVFRNEKNLLIPRLAYTG